jgi:hypothetical protein
MENALIPPEAAGASNLRVSHHRMHLILLDPRVTHVLWGPPMFLSYDPETTIVFLLGS